LAAATSLITLPPVPPPPAPAAPISPTQRGQDPIIIPGVLPDGSPYTPLYVLPSGTSLGQAPNQDGSRLRLVERAADGKVRVLRQLPVANTPQYVGFTEAEGEIVWAESLAGDREGRTEIWAVTPESKTAPRRVTADTGDVVFSNSEYDIVARNGRLHWLAVATRTGHTELRSVSLAGGAVTTRVVPGEWTLSAWPWLVSASASGPVRLRTVDTGRELTVPTRPTELVTCSPSWCRVLTHSDDGSTQLEVMRVDGSRRRPVAGDAVAVAVVDVALLDRFEVLSADTQATASRSQLLIYDIATDRTVVIAERASTVQARGGMVWWSTSPSKTSAWWVLNLRTLR